MNGMVSCEYNMDSGCIELKFVDGTEIAIDCTTVENLTANNMYERFELDYLIYNAPLAYADLIRTRLMKPCLSSLSPKCKNNTIKNVFLRAV